MAIDYIKILVNENVVYSIHSNIYSKLSLLLSHVDVAASADEPKKIINPTKKNKKNEIITQNSWNQTR